MENEPETYPCPWCNGFGKPCETSKDCDTGQVIHLYSCQICKQEFTKPIADDVWGEEYNKNRMNEQ
jgi:hypothetical protein